MSASSTVTDTGLVDVCTIFCDNSGAESRCEGGPITHDLTKWDFNKADSRNKCRKNCRELETVVVDWIAD